MSESDVSRQLQVAAALLLRPPDEQSLSVLETVTGERLSLAIARQDFYDTLCIAQSGRYIPPYRHVLLRAKEVEDYWYFPAPRYNGGDDLASWYESIGFDISSLNTDKLLQGPVQPLDHVGYLVSFLSNLVRLSDEDERLSALGSSFVETILGEWTRLYVWLLSNAGSDYLHFVADAINEALDLVIEGFPSQAVLQSSDNGFTGTF